MNDQNSPNNQKNQNNKGNRKKSKSNKRARNKNADGGKKRDGGKQKGRGAAKVDLDKFWGDPDALPERGPDDLHPGAVRAAVTSLGRPPLAGHETAAEHWFQMVYERSGVLAGALAAARERPGDEPD